MTHRSITRHCQSVQFSRCLEIGPGPGTWTRVLFRNHQSAEFDLVDISEETRTQFTREMRAGRANVRYHTSDILQFETGGQHDFVFSSRALEYVEDKRQFAARIADLLVSGAEGCLITKHRTVAVQKPDRPKRSPSAASRANRCSRAEIDSRCSRVLSDRILSGRDSASLGAADVAFRPWYRVE